MYERLPAPLPVANKGQKTSMRILIVEDEPTLGRQLKSTLEANGYAVDLSVDGEDGHFKAAPRNTMRSCSISACPKSTG